MLHMVVVGRAGGRRIALRLFPPGWFAGIKATGLQGMPLHDSGRRQGITRVGFRRKHQTPNRLVSGPILFFYFFFFSFPFCLSRPCSFEGLSLSVRLAASRTCTGSWSWSWSRDASSKRSGRRLRLFFCILLSSALWAVVNLANPKLTM